jgi:hypothetical protein
MTIQEIRVKWQLYRLNGLYMKTLKNVKVYSDPRGAGVVWQGWTMEQGKNAGRLNMFISQDVFDPQRAPSPAIKGLWAEFFINDVRGNLNAPKYYIKFEENVIDWTFAKNQISAETKANMTFYESWYDDLEKEVFSGLKTGLLAGGGILFFNYVVLPYVAYRVVKNLVSDTVKQAKNG